MLKKLFINFDRKNQLKKDIKKYHVKLVIWWCICKYLSREDEKSFIHNHNELLEKSKRRLYDIMLNMCCSLPKIDNKSIKRKALNNLWKDGYLFSLNLCDTIMEIFRVLLENISSEEKEYIDYNKYKSIANSFYTEKEKLITLISTEDEDTLEEYDKVKEYINETF